MLQPRKIFWISLSVGVGFAVWRWRQSQVVEQSPAAGPTHAHVPPPPTRNTTVVTTSSATGGANNGAARRIATRVHRGAPPEPPKPADEILPVNAAAAAPVAEAVEEVAAPVAEAVEEAVAEASEPVALVNINTADLQALIDLPGINESLARRIISHREEHGPFTSVDQLIDVSGIGHKNINIFRDQITV